MTVRMCWAPTARGDVCGGLVTWTRRDGRWWGRCAKCGATGQAAAGEARRLSD